VRDDYGDNATSLAFFENLTPPEQLEAAEKTRSLIKKLIGSYKMLQSAARHPENSDPALVTRARNADIFTIPVLWVIGNGVMGQTRRRKPKRLGRKLLAIRKRLDVSQHEMARLLNLKTSYTAVSGFEQGNRETDLLTLLRYARLGGVTLEHLVDDKMKLPDAETMKSKSAEF
jgi:DNA-binding XRE family transcriptional regulator